MPPERDRRLSEFSREDLAQGRAAAREDLLAELYDDTSQSEDDESELEEEEDDGEEGQGQEQNTMTILWWSGVSTQSQVMGLPRMWRGLRS